MVRYGTVEDQTAVTRASARSSSWIDGRKGRARVCVCVCEHVLVLMCVANVKLICIRFVWVANHGMRQATESQGRKMANSSLGIRILPKS